MQQHGWAPKTYCAEQARRGRLGALWLHLHEVQEQAELTYSDRKQITGEGLTTRKSLRIILALNDDYFVFIQMLKFTIPEG